MRVNHMPLYSTDELANIKALVDAYYSACNEGNEQLEEQYQEVLEEYYEDFNVDTIGDLEDKLIQLLK